MKKLQKNIYLYGAKCELLKEAIVEVSTLQNLVGVKGPHYRPCYINTKGIIDEKSRLFQVQSNKRTQTNFKMICFHKVSSRSQDEFVYLRILFCQNGF